MNPLNALLMQKPGSGVTDLTDSFGYAPASVGWPEMETKDVAVRDWPGADGEDVYLPVTLPLSAYDLDVEMIYVGRHGDVNDDFDALVAYLTGRDGLKPMFSVYDSRMGRGVAEAYVKKIKPDYSETDGTEDYQKLTVTFRVTNPRARVTLKMP